MRRFTILVILTAMFSVMSFAQAPKTFNSNEISFTYSSKFEIAEIENAPHMLLKLESDDGFLSVSKWEYGYDGNLTAWDFYDYAQDFSDPSFKLIKTEKGYLNIRNGKIKCIKSYSNDNGSLPKPTKVLTYVFIYRGNLFVCCSFSLGKFSKNSTATTVDKYFAGLYIKK